MLLGILVLFIVICQKGEANRLASCIMILIAVGLDCLDGIMAKSFNAESPLGKQLDSFADFVSFGLAPLAVLLTHNSFRDLGLIMYLSVSFRSAASAGQFKVTLQTFSWPAWQLRFHPHLNKSLPLYAVSERPFATPTSSWYILSVWMARINLPAFCKR